VLAKKAMIGSSSSHTVSTAGTDGSNHSTSSSSFYDKNELHVTRLLSSSSSSSSSADTTSSEMLQEFFEEYYHNYNEGYKPNNNNNSSSSSSSNRNTVCEGPRDHPPKRKDNSRTTQRDQSRTCDDTCNETESLVRTATGIHTALSSLRRHDPLPNQTIAPNHQGTKHSFHRRLVESSSSSLTLKSETGSDSSNNNSSSSSSCSSLFVSRVTDLTVEDRAWLEQAISKKQKEKNDKETGAMAVMKRHPTTAAAGGGGRTAASFSLETEKTSAEIRGGVDMAGTQKEKSKKLYSMRSMVTTAQKKERQPDAEEQEEEESETESSDSSNDNAGTEQEGKKNPAILKAAGQSQLDPQRTTKLPPEVKTTKKKKKQNKKEENLSLQVIASEHNGKGTQIVTSKKALSLFDECHPIKFPSAATSPPVRKDDSFMMMMRQRQEQLLHHHQQEQLEPPRDGYDWYRVVLPPHQSSSSQHAIEKKDNVDWYRVVRENMLDEISTAAALKLTNQQWQDQYFSNLSVKPLKKNRPYKKVSFSLTAKPF